MNQRRNMKMLIAFALVTTGLVSAQQQPQQRPSPSNYQEQQEAPQQGIYPPRQDLSAVLGALSQAMNGLRRLNVIQNQPAGPQTAAAKRAAIMMTSTAISAAVGAAISKDHTKGALIGAAVGGVVAMIIEEQQASKERRNLESDRRPQYEYHEPPPPPIPAEYR